MTTMGCAGKFADTCSSTKDSSAQLFLILISTLLSSKCSLGPEKKYPANYAPHLKDSQIFDFIVVGAGSAGSRLASRLSEVSKWSVLLLEAGTYPSSVTEIPLLAFTIHGNKEVWQYKMQPCETCCLGLKGNTCLCPRGKVVGGTSSINLMVYIRGNKNDFDGWAAAGNSGWDYNSVVKSFKQFEGAVNASCNNYGRNGDLKITRPLFDHPIRQVIIDGYGELGYAEYKEGVSLGYQESYTTIYRGTRSNSAKAFLRKTKKGKNLKMVVKAQVSRILIDHETKTAYGVEVKINDEFLKLKANKEIVLSAGVINSPQILMNSGIGPRKHLDDLNIQVVQNLKVGEYMQDHPIFIIYVTIDPSVLKPRSVESDIYRYFLNRTGPLGTIGLLSMVGFINTENDSVFPNLMFMQYITYPNDPQTIRDLLRGYNQPDEMADILVQLNQRQCILLLIPTLLHEKSAGMVRLRSGDPFDPPLIYPNYFSDNEGNDMQVMIEGVRWIERLLETEAFARHNPKIIDFNLPNCRGHEFQTDDFWRCSVRNFGANAFHQVGTCKMGPAEDPSAVVNPRLQVYGINGLRVADASIMPSITSGNTNAPSIMIGEKAAEFITKKWLQTII